jgi:hypothetical protein
LLRLARLIQAGAARRELPAVITAADAIVLALAILKRGAAMDALRIREAGLAATVSEQDQVLSQDSNLHR